MKSSFFPELPTTHQILLLINEYIFEILFFILAAFLIVLLVFSILNDK